MICLHCGKDKPHHGRGLCISCYNKQWYSENKERAAKTKREWYLKNKDKLSKRHTEYMRNRRRNDIAFRIRDNLSRRVRGALKTTKKDDSILQLIGCSKQELRNHLESKLKNGMTWDNYGKWHIDHIIPCASFDLTKKSQQLACFNYSNLQPLWAYDNLSKGAKVSYENI